jgi:hypothetical protein
MQGPGRRQGRPMGAEGAEGAEQRSAEGKAKERRAEGKLNSTQPEAKGGGGSGLPATATADCSACDADWHSWHSWHKIATTTDSKTAGRDACRLTPMPLPLPLPLPSHSAQTTPLPPLPMSRVPCHGCQRPLQHHHHHHHHPRRCLCPPALA